MHGVGTFESPDGTRYQGGWARDLKQGLGKKWFPNGDTYEVSPHLHIDQTHTGTCKCKYILCILSLGLPHLDCHAVLHQSPLASFDRKAAEQASA